MKVLCVCQGGTVRSAGLAWILKYHYGHDALSASAEKNSPETLRMLADWADHVVLMSREIPRWLSREFVESQKVRLLDVGADVYGSPFHPELQRRIVEEIDYWEASDWAEEGGIAIEPGPVVG